VRHSASILASRRRGPSTASSGGISVPDMRSPFTNPQRRCRGVVRAELDGLTVDRQAIPLVDDGRVHHVRILMGGMRDVETKEPSSVSGDLTVLADSSTAPLPTSRESRFASPAAGRRASESGPLLRCRLRPGCSTLMETRRRREPRTATRCGRSRCGRAPRLQSPSSRLRERATHLTRGNAQHLSEVPAGQPRDVRVE
jgi:hypothetical protein